MHPILFWLITAYSRSVKTFTPCPVTSVFQHTPHFSFSHPILVGGAADYNQKQKGKNCNVLFLKMDKGKMDFSFYAEKKKQKMKAQLSMLNLLNLSGISLNAVFWNFVLCKAQNEYTFLSLTHLEFCNNGKHALNLSDTETHSRVSYPFPRSMPWKRRSIWGRKRKGFSVFFHFLNCLHIHIFLILISLSFLYVLRITYLLRFWPFVYKSYC